MSFSLVRIVSVTPHCGIKPTVRFVDLLSCRGDRVERGRVERDRVERGRVERGHVERDRRLWRLSLA